MHWSVAASFVIDPRTDRWLVPFVRSDHHRFTLIPAKPRKSWHHRVRRTAGAADWAEAWVQGRNAWRDSRGGVITVFPQLAVVAGINQRLPGRRKPVVAWCFNLGDVYGGFKRTVARAALKDIDCFVVHSRAEVARYAEWLALPTSRFRFVPLQRSPIPIEAQEDQQTPFLLAMGSSKRDYNTLFAAVRASKHPTVVVAARHAIEGLVVPENVDLRFSLSARECHQLAQRARINVVPVLNHHTASGQVTIVEAMRMGRAVIATACMGSEDYIESDVNGLLVEPGAVDALRAAIERLWDDAELRRKLGSNAERFVARYCSDEAAGQALDRILDEIEASV